MNNTPTPSKNETAVRLYDEAQVFEGSRPSGLLIQGGDEILRLERELATVTEQRDRLAEALRKAISWGDSASHHILYRQNINWTYLNEAKEALQSLNQAAVKGGADE